MLVDYYKLLFQLNNEWKVKINVVALIRYPSLVSSATVHDILIEIKMWSFASLIMTQLPSITTTE